MPNQASLFSRAVYPLDQVAPGQRVTSRDPHLDRERRRFSGSFHHRIEAAHRLRLDDRGVVRATARRNPTPLTAASSGRIAATTTTPRQRRRVYTRTSNLGDRKPRTPLLLPLTPSSPPTAANHRGPRVPQLRQGVSWPTRPRGSRVRWGGGWGSHPGFTPTRILINLSSSFHKNLVRRIHFSSDPRRSFSRGSRPCWRSERTRFYRTATTQVGL